MPHPILLYDGVCGLCNRLVQFILRRDRAGGFQFAALQSALAGRVLARHGVRADDFDTVYVVVDYELPGERVLARSDAVIFILKELAATAELRSAGPPRAAVPTPAQPAPGATRHSEFAFWRAVARLLQIVPRGLRDWAYRVGARNRYRIFGQYDACPVPSEETRSRFLDL